MMRWTLSLLVVGLLLQEAPGGPIRRRPPPDKTDTHPALLAGADAQALAARIDFWLDARMADKGVVPADPVDDATFLRRAYLDLNGQIPDIVRAGDFLDNRASDKRVLLIDELLSGSRSRYPEHMATIWGQLLVPNVFDQRRQRVQGIEYWLAQEFARNASYRDMVRATIDPGTNQSNQNTAAIFLQANENKPENVAARVSRLFMGVKLECAQCHDHPFAPYTRQQFWETAAFFVTARNDAPASNFTKAEIVIPSTGKKVTAKFLDKRDPVLTGKVDARTVFADWLTAADNPWFARAAVNRVWESFFGIGIIDPIEEPGDENPPSHPELLNELAQAFVAHDYDLKYLMKALMLTKAYQRSSRQTHESQADLRLFARMPVRGLSPEQLFDSLAQATGNESTLPYRTGQRPAFNYNPTAFDKARADFLSRFVNQDRRTEHQTSILQALYLMNGKIMADATSLESNRNLRHLAEGQKNTVTTARKIKQLYLLTLSRKPRADELARLVPYLDNGGATGDSHRAVADIFWALLNSSEFALNH